MIIFRERARKGRERGRGRGRGETQGQGGGREREREINQLPPAHTLTGAGDRSSKTSAFLCTDAPTNGATQPLG